MPGRRVSVLLGVTILSAASSCSCSSGGGGDDAAADGRASADVRGDLHVDAAGDVGVGDARGDVLSTSDADHEAVPGPLTFVVTEAEFLPDRLCDLDGDGVDDNAFAELGSANASLFTMAINTSVSSNIELGARTVVHLPLVDDTTVPHSGDTAFIMFDGRDLDDPVDLSDDFSGEEPFQPSLRSLDVCGEPHYVSSATIDRGSLSAVGGTTALLVGAPPGIGRNAHVTGSIEPGGRAAELRSCSALMLEDIGDEPGPTSASGVEITTLETLLLGGAAWGMAGMPGISPDVDLDGDGFERFLTDAEGRITSCLDGDTTEIAGRDCWQDERMADAFAFAQRFVVTSALFGGRDPDWEERAEAECPGGIPESSVFDPR